LRNKDNFIIWTIYFNQGVSRKRGRKTSKKEAVSNPSLEEVLSAARNIGLGVRGVKKARYPAYWWDKNCGYIMVEKSGKSKIEIIRELAKEIRRRRGGK
jgi:signal recognition particle subunit SEC65